VIGAVGLGEATEALVTAGYVARTREGDRAVLETPSRRDFWHGHGFALDAPPSGKRLDALIAEGRERFSALGAERFVVRWERPYGAKDPLRDYLFAPGVEDEIVCVMRYDAAVPDPDPRVVAIDDDAGWSAAAELAAREYPRFAEYVRWRFSRYRSDVALGRARMVGVREGAEVVAVCGLYRGTELARFVAPVTARQARRRGYFSACARSLLAWALDDAPRIVAITADEEGPIPLYRRVGFVPVAWQDAVIVRSRSGRGSISVSSR
jgi:GNAT superfamily N-acetyltransferase